MATENPHHDSAAEPPPSGHRDILDDRLDDLEANPGDQSPWTEVLARLANTLEKGRRQSGSEGG